MATAISSSVLGISAWISHRRPSGSSSIVRPSCGTHGLSFRSDCKESLDKPLTQAGGLHSARLFFRPWGRLIAWLIACRRLSGGALVVAMLALVGQAVSPASWLERSQNPQFG